MRKNIARESYVRVASVPRLFFVRYTIDVIMRLVRGHTTCNIATSNSEARTSDDSEFKGHLTKFAEGVIV